MKTIDAALIAGIPAENNTLYHQIRFKVGDPTALILVNDAGGKTHRQLIIRDIEMGRAKKHARVDAVNCPADFAPTTGLSGDRETATAQSIAEFLKRRGVSRIRADRTLSLSYTDELRRAGVDVVYDPELGVAERRAKDEQEVAHLRQAQRDTESVIRKVCEMIARGSPDRSGVVHYDGAALTSERLFGLIDIELLKLGYDNPHRSIIACGKEGGDCHNRGQGPIYTDQPVIVDIFPKSKTTGYHGDCTRTVVNGAIPPIVDRMQKAVVAAKSAATKMVRAGVTGHAVNQETQRVLLEHGFQYALPPENAPADFISIPHGTGHGLGLDVHEPPLLADKGPELMVGDCVTVEPGLYGPHIGGVRIEDVVIVRRDGCINLGQLHEGLSWA